MTTIRRRLDRLEVKVPPPLVDLGRQRYEDIVARWDGLFTAAEPLLTDDEQDRVLIALIESLTQHTGPFAMLFWHLREGCCRLPELAPQAMKALLVAAVSPEADGWRVCNHCGLAYPQHKLPNKWTLLPGKQYGVGSPPWYDFPDFFQVCPSCGNSVYDVERPHMAGRGDHAWKDLDGYAGSRGAGTVAVGVR